jgi:hypothetical protein
MQNIETSVVKGSMLWTNWQTWRMNWKIHMKRNWER